MIKKFLIPFCVTLTFTCSSISWAKEIKFSTADEFYISTTNPLPPERVYLDLYSENIHTKAGSTARLPGLKASVGVFKDLQIYGVFPTVLHAPKKGQNHYGYGDVGAGFKYRFIHETDTLPAVAFYPKFFLPTGDSSLGLGNGTWIARLPLWIQKGWRNFTFTTGGGYHINRAQNKYNYPFGGVLVQWQITKYLMLGNELYAEGKISPTTKSRLNYTLGGSYFFNSSYFIAFSAGHSLAGPKRFTSFLGFGIAWGPVSSP